ncbi:hypothetical protein OKA05_26605 [Luteolibacter arcticus]|uniref:Uncharacterized protein n=1 Tax=Luteolibacter arcticus TaxID=1581411 RepID=A0ABT3GRK0_9BACT|nr:hypothetical protein [Luteolibacter arcticus]MCW1926157.1 hypothetical protein [Luteolibacter arcticus]
MKALLLSSLVLCSQAFAAGEGYTNFIRQTQQETGVAWNMPVVSKGQAASSGVLEGKGSLFQLWTIEQANAKDYLLDQKLVGAYLPAASITVKTLDPYTKVPRTRADQPFTVTYTVSGLLAGTGLPLASTRVLMEHHTAAYTAAKQTSIPLTTALGGKPLTSAYITTNGTAALSFPVTNLKAADPSKVNGEEHFVIHALSDGTITQSQIATALVQVWPVASGGVQGITAGQKIRFNLPTLSATYTDVYPGSSIWLQIYKGPEKLGTEGAVLPGSTWNNTNEYSAGNLVSVSDYSSLATTDGIYTIEMLTRTPFGLERLSHITFSVDRTLQIRAQMGEISQ